MVGLMVVNMDMKLSTMCNLDDATLWSSASVLAASRFGWEVGDPPPPRGVLKAVGSHVGDRPVASRQRAWLGPMARKTQTPIKKTTNNMGLGLGPKSGSALSAGWS